MAAVDSASHFTDFTYGFMLIRGRKDDALGKLERDYCDVGLMPSVREEVTPLYLAWKVILENYSNPSP